MNKTRVNSKYKPLFGAQTRYIVCTGGRGSGKSFAVSLYLLLLTWQKDQRVLFTRFTLVSAKDSIIPEFKEKIDLLGYQNDFEVTEHDIVNKHTGSVIMFRGIKTSSGIQTAKLKSLTDVTCWVLDEAEELPDIEIFKKIDRSIRTKKAENRVILVLNPCYRKHWLYKHFFTGANVQELHNGIKENTTYIHTSYKDNLPNLSDDFLADAKKTRAKNIQEYNEDFLGHWKDDPAGLAFPRAGLLRYQAINADVQPDAVVCYVDVADQGTDYLCAVFAAVVGRHIYIIDVIYTQAGHAVTIPLIVAKFRKHKVGRAIFESNNQGYIFGSNVRALCEAERVNTVVQLLKNSTNKETRIISNMDYINENFQFLSDTEIGHDSEYDRYLNDLSSWTLDGRFNPDDAPDATAGLAKMVQFL
jgi:PBSX family phage terminase large subunit